MFQELWSIVKIPTLEVICNSVWFDFDRHHPVATPFLQRRPGTVASSLLGLWARLLTGDGKKKIRHLWLRRRNPKGCALGCKENAELDRTRSQLKANLSVGKWQSDSLFLGRQTRSLFVIQYDTIWYISRSTQRLVTKLFKTDWLSKMRPQLGESQRQLGAAAQTC